MLTKDRILSTIDAIYAARVAGDTALAISFWTADATFQLVGDATLMHAMPVTPQSAHTSIGQMIDTFTFHSVERIDAIVEGNRAGVVLRVNVSVLGEAPRETLIYDLWDLDDNGHVKSLMEFADTAAVAQMLAKIAAPHELLSQ